MVLNGEVRSRDLWVVVTFRCRADGGIWMLKGLQPWFDLSVGPVAQVFWTMKRLLLSCDLSVLSFAVILKDVIVLTYQAPSDAH